MSALAEISCSAASAHAFIIAGTYSLVYMAYNLRGPTSTRVLQLWSAFKEHAHRMHAQAMRLANVGWFIIRTTDATLPSMMIPVLSVFRFCVPTERRQLTDETAVIRE